jgi:hypothetical protein
MESDGPVVNCYSWQSWAPMILKLTERYFQQSQLSNIVFGFWGDFAQIFGLFWVDSALTQQKGNVILSPQSRKPNGGT